MSALFGAGPNAARRLLPRKPLPCLLGALALFCAPAAARGAQGSIPAPVETRLQLGEAAPAVSEESREPEILELGGSPTAALPLSLAALPPGREDSGDWSAGTLFGVLHTKGGDQINLFAGIQGRVTLSEIFAVEIQGSIHRTTFKHDALRVEQYPVQLVAKIFPFPYWEIQPYVAGGVGFYYSQLEYRFPLNSQFSDGHNTSFGGQGGGGLELRHGKAAISLEADYVLLNQNANGLAAHSFDYWQILATLSFFF